MEEFFSELKTELAAIRQILDKNHSSDIITSSEVMKMLKISRNTYNRLKDEGIIKVYVLRGKLYSKRSEILEALESCKIN